MKKTKNKIKKRKDHNLIKIAFYFLLILFLLLFISQLIQSILNSKWRDKNQMTFVVEKNNKISFIKIDKSLEEILIYNFVDNIFVEVTNGYGEYRVDKLRQLANQEKKDFGKMLIESMTFYFGVITDGFIIDSKTADFNLKKIIVGAFFKRNKTNYSGWDLLQMYFYVWNLRSENIS